MWAPRPACRASLSAAAERLSAAATKQGVAAALGSAAGRRGFFFQRAQPLLLNIEGLESPRDFPRLAEDAIQAAKKRLEGAAQKPPLELVNSLDDASNCLCRIADAAELCRNVHPNKKFVAGANEAVQAVSAYMGEVNLDSGIYEGMKRAEFGEGFAALTEEAQAVLHHMRVAMEHEGIHLADSEKAECLQLLELEQHLAFDATQRQEQARRSPKVSEGVWTKLEYVQEMLGNQALALRRRGNGPNQEVLLPCDSAPLADLVLKTVPCSETRRRMYEAQQAPDPDGDTDIAALLRVRQRLAQMRGYSTWNSYAQREALLQTPERVAHFIDAAWDRLRPGLLADLQRLAAEKERLGLGEPRLKPWDVPLLLQRCKGQSQQEDLSAEYLTYGSLMRGVNLILSRLLGLSFVSEEPNPGEVWHPSVQKFTLRQQGGKEKDVVGILYLDPFARPGKVVQSAQFTLQGSKDLGGGSRQVPITTLVYSLVPGARSLPLCHAVTFMHEIGHAVHSLLSETTYQHLSGTRGTIDFVEFPSHLFEHFVLDPSCLAAYAYHAESGAAMSAEVRESVRQSQLGFAHFDAVQQLMYAALDQAFYNCIPQSPTEGGMEGAAAEVQQHLDASLARFDEQLQGPFDGSLRELLGLSRPSKFDHLVHYGGSYYCYLFNRALSAHVWRHGFREDPFGSVPGSRLRALLRGGSAVQSLEPILELCPGAGGFRAEDVPLDALVTQLGGGAH